MAATANPVRPASAGTRRPAFINGGEGGKRRAEALHGNPSGGGPDDPGRKSVNWATLGFMAAIHGLALIALLPQFWSWQAIVTVLVLYWVTACLGVTIGYHRLLSHRSFRVPHWLERFFATCGAISCQQGPLDWVASTAITTSFPIRMLIITPASKACGGPTWAGCLKTSPPCKRYPG